MESLNSINVTWMLVCSALVFFLQAGFCSMECGLTRSKNSINSAMKNIADFCIAGALFWTSGYALMFGRSFYGLFGGTDFFFEETSHSTWLMVFFVYQLMYCGTTSTIASGAVAERMRFKAYAIMSAVIAGLIYPVFGHWVWTRPDIDAQGWLAQLGFIDFAGGTVVHGCAAWAALAAIVVIGPRVGKFQKDGTARTFHGSNLPLAALGLFILWFGWFGFIGGKTQELSEMVPHLLVNTLLAGVFGGLGNLIFQFVFRKYYSIESFMSGVLAGLVAICAGCNVAGDSAAIILGASAGVLVELAKNFIERRLKLDDSVNAIAIHGVAGAWGIIAVPFLLSAAELPMGHSRWSLLAVQSLGILVNFSWSFGVCFSALKLVQYFMPLRVSEEEEQTGLNTVEHNAITDLHDLLVTMSHNVGGDMSRRANEDPSSEAGMIAYQYNRVLDARGKALDELQMYTDRIDFQRSELELQAQQLESARHEAEHANETKTQFLANMSHEIRTPMTSILGYVDLLLDELDTQVDTEERMIGPLQVIKRNGNHLLEIINDILDISKIEAGRLTAECIDCDVMELIDDVSVLMRHRAEQRGLVLDVRYLTPVPKKIQTDPTRLRQILLNLIGNAVKFTAQGEVRIEVRFVPRSAGKSQIEFAIIDSGIGMNAEQVSKLFQPFRQADGSTTRKYGGTGLGLTISGRLAQLLGGEIRVASEPEKGSTFTLTIKAGDVEGIPLVLPKRPAVIPTDEISNAVKDASPASVAKDQPSTAVTRNLEVSASPAGESRSATEKKEGFLNCRILLAEDGPDNQRLISFILKKAGAEVFIVENGQMALDFALAAEHGVLKRASDPTGPFDLILMDMLMPVMDGCQATQKLREAGFQRPIIALTANAMKEDRDRCLEAGCNDFCTKPVDRPKLFATIDSWIRISRAQQTTAATFLQG